MGEMKEKAFIFDMDGVIIDSEPIHSKAKLDTFRHFGIPFAEGALIHYMGRTSKDLFSEALEMYPIKGLKPETMMAYKHRRYLEIISEGSPLRPIEGIYELLSELNRKNIPIRLASSTGKNLIRLVLNRLEIQEYFTVIVSGAELPRSKPDPAIYLLAAEKLGVEPAYCTVVEDAASGVAAAKAAGMYCIAYHNVNSGNQELSRADKIVESLLEIDLTE